MSTVTGVASLQYRYLLDQCIHCGLCLPACPTYAVYGTEMESPRGRIDMMRAAADGRIEPDEFQKTFRKHIENCLTCLACQTACPSSVRYGELVHTTRLAIEHSRRRGWMERLIRWLGFHQLMPNLYRLRALARLVNLYEVIGLQTLVRRLNVLPKPLKILEDMLPPVQPGKRNLISPAPAIGVKRGEVAFFLGCIQEAFLSPVNDATIRLLQRNGYEVHFPQGQTCCGAAQFHFGETQQARRLALKNLDAFERYEVIIINAGGCGATLKTEYASLFADEPFQLERSRNLATRVQDISEFLCDHLITPLSGTVPLRAVYVDSCHLRHGQKIIRQPRDLLRSIPGLELVELELPERCCGSAGVYNLVHPETADPVLGQKMADIASTGAELVICSNTGCHMQLLAGVRKAGLNARVMHLVEVLEMSYAVADDLRKGMI